MHRLRTNIANELANNRIDPVSNNNHSIPPPNIVAAKLLSSCSAALHPTQAAVERREESTNNDFFKESSRAATIEEVATKLISTVNMPAVTRKITTTTATEALATTATATKQTVAAIKFISNENENDVHNINKSIAKSIKTTTAAAPNSVEATNAPTTVTMKVLNECTTSERQQPQKQGQQLEQQILINTSEFNQINLKSSLFDDDKLDITGNNKNLLQQSNKNNSNSKYNNNENHKSRKSKRPAITSTTTTTTTTTTTKAMPVVTTAATATSESPSAPAPKTTMPSKSTKIIATGGTQTTERAKSTAPTLHEICTAPTSRKLDDVASERDNKSGSSDNNNSSSGASDRICNKHSDYGGAGGGGGGGDGDGKVRNAFAEASSQSVPTTYAKITNTTIETTTATMIAARLDGVTQAHLQEQQQQQQQHLQQKTTTSHWVKANTNDDNQVTEDNSAIAGIACAEQSKVTSLDLDQRFGCAHYKRRAMFVTPCCNKFYKCRFCHDENEGHHFDRKTLTELICSECNTRQKVQEQCEHCGTRFGKYTCLICNLFDDTDKKQYHCNGCGICRIGGAENFFHCAVCDMCLPIRLKIDGHRCVENISRSHCPVCLGDIHTSRIPCHIPDCGHLLHKTCFDELLKSGHYTCPICQTSLIDMTALWEYLDAQAVSLPIPKKYENQRIHIFCNDCHKTSKTKFNFIGLKCMQCGAYNTTQDVKRRMSLVTDEPSTA